MIVKNEERFLSRCLESVKPYVNEIIIVDTGSEDRTVEIAQMYTDKIYFHPWEKDFSKHRNQSISYATGDWILQVDADEELAPGGGEAILESIRKVGSDVNFLILNITNMDQKGMPRSSFNFPRVFRNRVGIHYEGIVHNQLVGHGRGEFCSAVLFHYGYYLEEGRMEEKRRRSIPLMLRQLEEDPNNVFAMYNLANMYAGMKDYPSAIGYAERALSILRGMESVPTLFMGLYSPLIAACIKEGKLGQARKYAEESVRIFEGLLDGYYLLNEVSYLQGDWKAVLSSGEKALHLYEALRADPSLLGPVICYYLNSRYRLALRTGSAMLRLGDVGGAERLFDMALGEHPEPGEAFRFILKVARECGEEVLYERFLNLALEQCPEDVLFSRLDLKRALEENRPTDEILKILDRLIQLEPGENWRFRRAVFLLERGNLGDAERAFSDLLAVDGASAQYHAYRALARELMGDIQGAISDHRAAVSMDEALVYSWGKMGENFLALGMCDEALESFQRARKAGEEGPEVLLRIAILGIKMGKLTLSVDPLEQLLVMLGLCNERAIESPEELASVFEEIGQALKKKGQKRLAAEAYGVALEMHPSGCIPGPEGLKQAIGH